MLKIFFISGFCFSIVYGLVQCFLVLRFSWRKKHGESILPPYIFFSPRYSLLRALAGRDEATVRNLLSGYEQSAAPSEVLYGIDSADKPVLPDIKTVGQKYSAITTRVESVPNSAAANKKIGKLMNLEKEARHDILIAVDQDIFLPPDHLKEVVSYFGDPSVGMVTSLYRLNEPITFGDSLERLSVHTDFFPSVLTAEALEGGLRFAFGATMALRKEALNKIGGFQSVQDCLADDYQLGLRICSEGYRVVLSASIVEHSPGKLSFADYMSRAVRAARTHRVCRPSGYALSVLTQPLPWLAAILVILGFQPVSLIFIAAWLLIRMLLAAAAYRALRAKSLFREFLLIPLHDAARLVFWISAFAGNRVVWRGIRYRVDPSGRMERIGRKGKE